MSSEVWTYRESTLGSANAGADVVGYGVEALDGSIGKIDEATYDAGSAYVIVDTVPWIFGKKVMRREGLRQPHERADQERAGV